ARPAGWSDRGRYVGGAVVVVGDLEVGGVGWAAGRYVGRVVGLARGVVLRQDAAGAVVEEVLPTAARIARANEVAKGAVLVAPGLDVGAVGRRIRGETRRRIRLDVQHHAAQGVVPHPAHDLVRSPHAPDHRGLASWKVLHLDVALLAHAAWPEALGGAHGAPVAVLQLARERVLMRPRIEVGRVPEVRRERVVLALQRDRPVEI